VPHRSRIHLGTVRMGTGDWIEPAPVAPAAPVASKRTETVDRSLMRVTRLRSAREPPPAGGQTERPPPSSRLGVARTERAGSQAPTALPVLGPGARSRRAGPVFRTGRGCPGPGVAVRSP